MLHRTFDKIRIISAPVKHFECSNFIQATALGNLSAVYTLVVRVPANQYREREHSLT